MSEAPDPTLTGLDDAALVAQVNTAMGADDLERVIAALSVLQARHAGNPALRQRLAIAHNNRGSRLAKAGSLRAAEIHVQRALDLDPGNTDALYNRARLLCGGRNWREALDVFAHLLSLRPDDPEVALDSAETAALIGIDGASERLAACVERVAGDPRIDPIRLAAALATLGLSDACCDTLARSAGAAALRVVSEPADRLREGCDWQAAQRAYAIAAAFGGDGQRTPALRAALGARLALPMVYASADAMHAARAAFASGLQEIETTFDRARLRQCDPALEQLAWTNQMLAYQGGDDRQLASRYGDWMQSALAVMAPQLRPVREVRRAGTPRIGLVSSGFYRSVLGNYFGGWIGGLADAGLAPSVFLIDTPADASTAAMLARAAACAYLSGSIESMAQAIRDADMDVLIYPDVGIDARATVLASMRLAPRQLAGWGHPVSTGLPSIDGFISCASMEPADGASHYREALHLLPGIGTAFFDPGEPAAMTRADFDLPSDAHLYLVPHVAPKLHPDCDRVFAQIAANDPRAILVTFRFDRPVVRDTIALRLHAALREAGADPQRQLRVLPYLPRPRFLGLCTIADVMLDTLHWSGGANTVDALRCSLPVVTCPGAFMRGRQTFGMLRSMQLDAELACPDPQALVARAVAVASDRDLRAELSRRIDAAVPILFDGSAALQGLAEVVRAQLET